MKKLRRGWGGGRLPGGTQWQGGTALNDCLKGIADDLHFSPSNGDKNELQNDSWSERENFYILSIWDTKYIYFSLYEYADTHTNMLLLHCLWTRVCVCMYWKLTHKGKKTEKLYFYLFEIPNKCFSSTDTRIHIQTCYFCFANLFCQLQAWNCYPVDRVL